MFKEKLLSLLEKMKKVKRKQASAAFLVGLVVAVGAYYLMQPNELEKAAKVGEKTTHQLLVQIENLKGCVSGCLERGDIVMIAGADKQWSIAEREGFLIIKMDITPAQADILVKALEKDLGEDPDGRPMTEELKRRKYMIDLARIGIAPNDEKGRIVGQIFGWDVVIDKK